MPSDPQNRVLIVTALHFEAAPFLLRIGKIEVRGRNFFVGIWNGRAVGLLRTGVGWRRARDATRAVLAEWDAACVVSAGTCGSVDRDFRFGEVVTADRCLHRDREGALVSCSASPFPGLRTGSLATVRRVVATTEARAQWRQDGAHICDMEAAAVREAAGDRPFAAVKVVSDPREGRDWLFTRAGPLLPLQRYAFQLRAWKLCRSKLIPAVEAGLGDFLASYNCSIDPSAIIDS